MFLTKLALNRPVSLILFLVTLCVFGVSAIFGFKMSYQPEIEMPTYLVITPYIGADPEIVNSTISEKVEKLGSTITGFSESTTISEENMSTVIFMFDYDIDKNQTYLDLKTAVDQLDLPADASSPILMAMSFDTGAMMSLSVTATGNDDARGFAEDTVVPQIEALMGVADVDVFGGVEDYVRIVVDPTLLQQYGLSMGSIGNAIAMYDFELPLGTLTQGKQDLSVSSGSELTSLAQLQDVVLTTASGDLIALKEVAKVSIGAKSPDSISRYNGVENVNIDIMNAQDANIPVVAGQVEKAVAKLQAENPNYEINITSSESDLIITTLLSVLDTLLLAVLLCMLVLFVFLGNFRASLIVGSAIPLSLMVTVICMNACNFELNMITSSALMIAIGMMVDNSIVVLESIFKVKARNEFANLSGKEQFKAVAFKGCEVVGASVVASTITTIVVYLPLASLGGVSGQMFVQLSFTIVFAMIASLFSATILVPMFYFLLKPVEKRTLITIIMEQIEKGYEKVIPSFIKHKFLVVFTSFALLVGSFALVSLIPLELMPATDSGTLIITAKFRPNSLLDVMSEEIRSIEEMLLEDSRLDSYQLSISGNTASIRAETASGISTFDLVDDYLLKTQNLTNMTVDVAAAGDEFMTSMTGDLTLLTTTLSGLDYEALQAASVDFEKRLYEVEGVDRVSSSLGDWGSTKADIVIDPKKALDYGTSAISVAQSLRLAVTGYEAGNMDIGLEEYEIIIENPAHYSDDLHLLMSLPIDTPTGQVPLSQMAEMKFTDNLQSIKKINGIYCIDLTISPQVGTNAYVADELAKLEENHPYGSGIEIGNGPGMDYMTDEILAMLKSNLTAIFLVFMVMAMQFESLRFSIMVMTSVSFSFIGSFGLLYLSGEPLTVVSMMGVLMLMGIVVNNGILFVDTANQLRKTMPLEKALMASGKMRLRPIVMTTLTTVLSMVPLALGIGEGTEMMQSMGIIIIGGLIASTILVLFLMPTFYLIIDKKEKKPKHPPKGGGSGKKKAHSLPQPDPLEEVHPEQNEQEEVETPTLA